MNDALVYLDELNDKRRKRIARLAFIKKRTRNRRIRKKVEHSLFVDRFVLREMEQLADELRKRDSWTYEVSTTLEERLWKPEDK